MAGRIDENAIRDIRERANLFEVVSDVVSLRRRGRSAVGLCPFHTEKTPSFTVSEERGFFHCFGCGEHGDVFTFVMKTQALPFPEAVRAVAERFGIPVPEDTGGPRTPAEPLVAVNAAAQAYFRGALRGPAGARARAYLAERGVAPESVERFALGFAPGGGDTLARHLRTQGLRLDDAVTAGLVMRRDSGGFLDRFRERLIFPIADAMGRVVAFGGRILPGGPESADNPPPKYLNSPESPLFHKGRMVYGLGLAREAIRKRNRVIVVEGYLDVIALAQAGIEEVVAPLGTALTADQLRVLRRFSESVLACFDGDTAGRRAAARSFPIFIEAGLWGRGAFLPSGDDPDTYVRTHGRDALETVLGDAVPLVDAYIAELAGAQGDAVGRRADAAREVARVLRALQPGFERDGLARLAAQHLGVRELALREEGTSKAPAASEAPNEVTRGGGAEELLVELLVAEPNLAARVRAENILGDFEHPTWRSTAERLVAGGAALDRSELLQTLPRTLRDRVARRLLGENTDEDHDRMVADCIAAIRSRRARSQRGRLLEELRAAQARGDLVAERQLTKHLTEKTRT